MKLACAALTVQLLWLEVPTNPLLLMPPLPLIAKVIHSLPEETRPLVVVDTTFLSSFYFTPLVPRTPDSLPLGDIVLSSLSKYSGGHSDLILGSVTVSPRTRQIRPRLVSALRFIQNSHGGVPSPRDCHLMIRSLKTLSIRTLKHGLNALRIAEWLENRPEVDTVRYPGLRSSEAFHQVEPLLSANARRELEFLGWKFPFKQHARPAGDAATGSLEHVRSIGVPFGGVITFTLKDASEQETERFVTSLRLVALAESLGGVESLIEVPYGMTHAVSSDETLRWMTLISGTTGGDQGCVGHHAESRALLGRYRGRRGSHCGPGAGVFHAQAIDVRDGTFQRCERHSLLGILH